MLLIKKILLQIETNIEAVISEETTLGHDLWNILLQQHPADISFLVERLTSEQQVNLFKKLPKDLATNVFEKLQETTQAHLLVSIDVDFATVLLKNIATNKLTDLFDYLSDEDLEKYLKLLQTKQRSQIISLLSFSPDSAGGRMRSDVLTLHEDFTVRKSIEILQRLSHKQTPLTSIYITDKDNILVGYITLDQLVLNKPDTLLSHIMSKNELIVYVDEDQEDVANQMQHYDLLAAPVVDKDLHFLGMITADDVIDIIKEEESEDVYKMSGLSPMEHSYFATPFWNLVWQRIPWLTGLLLLQSFSSFILSSYSLMLSKYTIIAYFLTMLVGTGGNAGNQSATIVIRGLTTKEITMGNGIKLLLREGWVSIFMAFILLIVSFIRVFYSFGDWISAFAISISLFLIIITSVILGSCIPLILERFGLDPAHSAAPFLTTLMDILGVLIYCFVCSKIFG
jgi:magnesium transporter